MKGFRTIRNFWPVAIGLLVPSAAGALALALWLFVPVLESQTGSGYFLRICSSTTQCHTVPIVTSDTFALVDGAQAFTNKTVDAEGTGNIITAPVKIWRPAAVCQNVTAVTDWNLPTTNPAVATCQTGTNTQKGVLAFSDDGATVITAQTPGMMLPTDFTGTVDVRLKWYTTVITGNVIWSVASICVADAETSDPAFNTASTVTDAAKGTTLQDNDATITGLTITGCAAGELMYLKVSRDPSGSDTLGATASLRGIELTYRRAM